jgi:hypothetical protein
MNNKLLILLICCITSLFILNGVYLINDLKEIVEYNNNLAVKLDQFNNFLYIISSLTLVFFTSLFAKKNIQKEKMNDISRIKKIKSRAIIEEKSI